MKSFFKEFFEYNFHFNQKIIRALNDHPQRISPRLIQLQSHIVNSHRVWNSKFMPLPEIFKPWDIHTIDELITLDNENFHTSVSILDRFDLESVVSYELGSGAQLKNTMRDVLFQIINHSTYHRGQIAAEFRKCGIEPLLTDWIVYKMS